MRKALGLLAALVLATGCMGDDGGGGNPAAKALRDYMLQGPQGDERLRERLPAGVAVPDTERFLVLHEGGWSVAAVELESEFGAFAAPLRKEGDAWTVAQASEKLRIVEGPPEPGFAISEDQRVGFAVYSEARDLLATLWIDGEKHELRGAGGSQFTRYWAMPMTLAAGSHLAVVLAWGDGRAAAVAWTFSSN